LPFAFGGAFGPRRLRSFKFKKKLDQNDRFYQMVNEVWSEYVPHLEPCHVIFHKLHNLGGAIAKWSNSFSSQAKLHLHMALEIIICLDVAQESVVLSLDESDLHKQLKGRVISLAILDHARKKQ
jgi:hypothetical protein